MSTRDIRISVAMGDDTVESIRWQADDAAAAGLGAGEQDAAAMLLALWDGDARQAMRLDLWTPQMTVEDMNDFVFQTLLTLADTYRNATGDKDLMAEIKLFARDFAEKASAAERRRQGRP